MTPHNHPAGDALRAAGFGPEDNAALDRACGFPPAAIASGAVLRELRELRLWHWLEYLALPAADKQAKAGTRHMRAVQTLNSFFPAGDYAEGDAAKQDVS